MTDNSPILIDSVEVKPAVTRKLRRRPNDPLPAPEKRRKTSHILMNSLPYNSIIEDFVILLLGTKHLSAYDKCCWYEQTVREKGSLCQVMCSHFKLENSGVVR